MEENKKKSSVNICIIILCVVLFLVLCNLLLTLYNNRHNKYNEYQTLIDIDRNSSTEFFNSADSIYRKKDTAWFYKQGELLGYSVTTKSVIK